MLARPHPSRLVLLGHPVAHSLSPLFQNAALAAVGLPQRYEVLDVTIDTLPSVLRALALEGAAGNVTRPLKESVAAMTSRCSALAARTGAVNTFWCDDGQLIGHNTDVAGVESALTALCPAGVRDRPCAVLGAGGSAAAVLVALDRLGVGTIRMWARTQQRVTELSARVAVPVVECETPRDAVAGAMLVINATPLGLHDDLLPVDVALLEAGASVLDLVYRRSETAFVRASRARGLPAQDGLHMLVEQGAAAFRCWFGIDAPRHAMWQALEFGEGAKR